MLCLFSSAFTCNGTEYLKKNQGIIQVIFWMILWSFKIEHSSVTSVQTKHL